MRQNGLYDASNLQFHSGHLVDVEAEANAEADAEAETMFMAA